MIEIKLKSFDDFELAVAVFDVENPKALVQIVHGALEHKERYYDFIEFLNANNYSVIISDNRGHGASINNEYSYGFMNGSKETIEDLKIVSQYIKSLHKDKPLYMFGHSLGSMFARVYLQKYDTNIEKLVLSGSPCYEKLAPIGYVLSKTISKIQGKSKLNKFLFNLAWKDKKGCDWLSYNLQNIENYKNDSLCQISWKNSGLATVIETNLNLHKFKNYNCKNKELKIMFLSGENDIVTGSAEGLNDSIKSLNRVGYQNIISVVYPNMKHEILQEDKKMQVYKDILDFFNN